MVVHGRRVSNPYAPLCRKLRTRFDMVEVVVFVLQNGERDIEATAAQGLKHVRAEFAASGSAGSAVDAHTLSKAPQPGAKQFVETLMKLRPRFSSLIARLPSPAANVWKRVEDEWSGTCVVLSNELSTRRGGTSDEGETSSARTFWPLRTLHWPGRHRPAARRPPVPLGGGSRPTALGGEYVANVPGYLSKITFVDDANYSARSCRGVRSRRRRDASRKGRIS